MELGPHVGAQACPRAELVVAPGAGQALDEEQAALPLRPTPRVVVALGGNAGHATTAGVADREAEGGGSGQAEGSDDLAVLRARVGVLDRVGESSDRHRRRVSTTSGMKPVRSVVMSVLTRESSRRSPS